uniref:Uncharacterized protein n=1 Tax=Arundo donax TaxID=35708 RepID=A0A0A9FNZ7_ARUDO
MKCCRILPRIVLLTTIVC